MNNTPLVADEIYWLHPQDAARPKHPQLVRLMQGKAEVSQLWRSGPTSLMLRIPEAALFTMAQNTDVKLVRGKLKPKDPARAIVTLSQSINARLEGEFWVAHVKFPAVNSGVCETPHKRFNLFRDVFIVPHVKHDGQGQATVVWSLKNKEGWEIGTAQ